VEFSTKTEGTTKYTITAATFLNILNTGLCLSKVRPVGQGIKVLHLQHSRICSEIKHGSALVSVSKKQTPWP
jgi:hypothetical protein